MIVYNDLYYNNVYLPYYLYLYNLTDFDFKKSKIKWYLPFRDLGIYDNCIVNTCLYLLDIYDNSVDSNMKLIDMYRFCTNFHTKKSRLKKRLLKMCESDCLFLSLTFDEDNIKYANDVNVKRFLNKLNCEFVANVDYGGLYGRKHYHAVVQLDFIDCSLWSYGNLDVLKIRKDSEDFISKYLMKLTNHSFKETTKVIYSRKKRK